MGAGGGFVLLCSAALAIPFVLAWLLSRLIKGFPRNRYYGHGQDTPLIFPTKFVVTSAVQGMAAGTMFMFLFFCRGAADPMSIDVLAGQTVGVALFFGAIVGGGMCYVAFGGRPLEDVTLLGSFVACFLFAVALYLSSGDNLKYGWGTVRPGESTFESADLGGIVRFMATERDITQRETEVMELLVTGRTRREICEELTVSPDTVKTHVRSVYRKLGVHSQQELIDRVIIEKDRLMLDGGAEKTSEAELP